MNKALGVVFLLFIVSSSLYSQIWFAKNAQIRFFSRTPLEDIEATNDYALGAINLSNGKVYFKVMMKSFKFEKALMQEHFNENYIESDKYPSAEFDGIITNYKLLKTVGTYEVIIKGKLSMHGVSVDREIKAVLAVSENNIDAKSFFKVPCHDHNVKIPKVTRKNISDDIEVTLIAKFNLKQS